MQRIRSAFTALLLVAAATEAGLSSSASAGQGSGFRSGVVAIEATAIVREKSTGRFVTNLGKADLEILDRGQTRPLAAFYAGEAPVSIALLFDIRNRTGPTLRRAREALTLAADRLRGADEMAVFTLEGRLAEVVGFTTDRDRLRGAKLDTAPPAPRGALGEATTELSKLTEARDNRHRAVLLITDALNDEHDAGTVTTAVAAMRVPMFILVVAPPASLDQSKFALPSVAPYSGGWEWVAIDRRPIRECVPEFFATLRSQYVLVFEATPPSGFHPLSIRSRRADVTVVSSRRGYLSPPAGAGPTSAPAGR